MPYGGIDGRTMHPGIRDTPDAPGNGDPSALSGTGVNHRRYRRAAPRSLTVNTNHVTNRSLPGAVGHPPDTPRPVSTGCLKQSVSATGSRRANATCPSG